MKNLIYIIAGIVLFIPTFTFAIPVDSIGVDINTITCPNGAEYNICGGVNAELHNKFVSAMKKKNAIKAIDFWDKMSQTVDGSDDQFALENVLLEPLFGTFQPEGVQMLPGRILAKKAYKGGIISLGTDCIQDCDLLLYYVSFMRYKNQNIYVYNESLVPINSKQYKTYSRLYKDDYTGSKFPEFDKDITASFVKGRFNNKDTHAVYQKFIKSIR